MLSSTSTSTFATPLHLFTYFLLVLKVFFIDLLLKKNVLSVCDLSISISCYHNHRNFDIMLFLLRPKTLKPAEVFHSYLVAYSY